MQLQILHVSVVQSRQWYHHFINLLYFYAINFHNEIISSFNWSRTNYRLLLLVFVRLFLYHLVHPVKYPVILNVTLRLTFDANIYNLHVQVHIRDHL